MRYYFVLIIFSFVVTACTAGPDFGFGKLSFLSEEAYINQKSDKEEEHNTMAEWWTRIGDSTFDVYVDQLLSENLALKQSYERIVQAKQNIRLAKADYYPTIGVDSGAGRSFANSALTDSREYSDSYNFDLTSSWQLDLFGRIKRETESAQANFSATLYDQEALKQSLVADLLRRRVAIAVNQKLLSLARGSVRNRDRFFKLVKQRYDLGAGSTTIGDVYLADENLTSAKTDIYEFERLLSEEMYQFDTLLGQAPGTTLLSDNKFPILAPPIDIKTCLPAALLDRRPDLKASKLRAKAANADIGVAVADLYPSLSLSGLLGFSSDNDGDIFSAQSFRGSLLSQVTARIFEGGRLRANIALQESEARELLLVYSEDILEALREVETSLGAEKDLRRQIKNQKLSVSSLKKAERFSKERYESGIETLQNFLDTQQRRYSAEQALYRLQQTLWNTRISLYLALGGDWFDDSNKSINCESKGVS